MSFQSLSAQARNAELRKGEYRSALLNVLRTLEPTQLLLRVICGSPTVIAGQLLC